MGTHFPVAIEPHYDPSSPYAGNAAMNWVRAQNAAGEAYILQDGTVVAAHLSAAGQWADVAPADVPAEWTAKYPGVTDPQKWAPENPADPMNVLYQYATLYGRGGWDLWVLGAEATAALAEARATIVPVPADVIPAPIEPLPAPLAAPASAPYGFFAELEALMARWRARL